MKTKIGILLAMMLLCIACTPRQNEVVSAAMEIYEKYADHSENLTVAFIGDYQVGQVKYNAIMFEATDSAEWEWLKHEFGIIDPNEISSMRLPDGTPIQTPDYMDGPPNGVVMGSLFIDSTLRFEDSASLMAYIDSLAAEILKDIAPEGYSGQPHGLTVINLDSMPQTALDGRMESYQEIANYTRNKGKAGYLINADIENHKVWLFFYDKLEDERLLLEHTSSQYSTNPAIIQQK